MSRRRVDGRMVSNRLSAAQAICDKQGWFLELTLEGLPCVTIFDVDEIIARVYAREEWEFVGEFLWRVCDKIEALYGDTLSESYGSGREEAEK